MKDRLGDYYASLDDTQWGELVGARNLWGKTPAIVAYALFKTSDLPRVIGHLGHACVVALADAFAHGALKYGKVGDWRNVPLDHHIQAAGRHFDAWLKDASARDTESGLTHEAHFLARAVMIQELRRTK